MINRKDTPAPFMQWSNTPSMSRTVVTTTTTTTSSGSATHSTRGSKQQRGRETYSMEATARGSADEPMQDARISHDLNLTQNPRHSVVDNMLMSFNPRPTFSSGSETTEPPQTSHSRHLHSSSTASDYTFPSDETSERRSYQFSRGRRSQSSSNIPQPFTLPRIDSVNAKGESADRQRARIADPQGISGAAGRRGHGKKASKGSTSSSLDYGQTRGQAMMPQQQLNRRSASFDHGYAGKSMRSASESGSHPPMPTNRSYPLVYNDLDAAPMPTVPGGPRRGDQSPGFPPTPAHLPASPGAQRRNSIQSSKSKGGRLNQEPPPAPAGTSFLSSRRGSKQPTAGFMRSRNPSPSRATREMSTSMHEPPMSPKEALKDKPGFFRRLFSHGQPFDSQSHQQPQPTREATRSNNRNVTPSNRLYKPPALEDLTQAQKENVPPPLAKKPSSFFRRRKKSVSEIAPEMPLSLQTSVPAGPVDEPQRSPASSLRKVMNPYLDSTTRSPRSRDGPPSNARREEASKPKNSKNNQLRPSTEPAPQDPSSHLDSRLLYRRNRNLPTLTDTSNAKNVLSLKATENSFLRDDSSDSRTSEPAEVAAPAKTSVVWSPGTLNADLAPRSSSKNAPNYSSSHNTSELSARRDDAGKTKAMDERVPLADSQATPTKSRPEPKQAGDKLEIQPSYARDNNGSGVRRPSQTDDGTETPQNQTFHSAKSTAHAINTNDIGFPGLKADEPMHKGSLDIDPCQPTDADRAQAKLVFDGDESIAEKSTAAAWLGEPGPDRARVRHAYMQLFKWQNLNILAALRDLCGRLYLKGESQQVDRILDSFSIMWCSCNPLHGFKATDIVHTICYSVLLLNTDLHQAEIETKMTRTQFLRNIMPTIRRVVTDAAPDAFINPRASTLPKSFEQRPDPPVKSPTDSELRDGKRSFEGQRPVYRLSQRPSDQTVYSMHPPPSPIDYNTAGNCGPLVKVPFHGKLSTWETQIEVVLKEFFNSVRQQPLPLFGSEGKQPPLESAPSATSLSAATGNFLRRTPSMLSKAGSDTQSYSRGRAPENRLGTARWQSKTRSRPRLYPSSTVASSRRSSLDEQSSVTSPSVTSAWSKFSSLGKTQTTMSTDSFASSYPHVGYQQSIGFANALSQAIIREEGNVSDEESLRAAPLLEDERLELAGAPWAKEGMMKHKHHLESIDKKAKDRNWVESFAVIEKGNMRLFSFSMNARSLRQKAKSQKAAGGVVGGGNWADNAELLGSFVLRQTIASALPPPGYSKARPHVWALSLPTGAVHLFQVGTPEIVQEFVKTANYWSARLSKEPLVGAIGNIEYGWSDSVINAALVHPDLNAPSSASISGTRPSLQSSIRSTRSSMDQGSIRPKLPGDKIMINEWTPPPQSMVASALMEVDQLKALTNYVKNIEDELQRHNELRGAVLLAFSPRHLNANKAMTNWERKSSYLLREIVKFRTYIDALQIAQTQKERIYAEEDGKATASTAPSHATLQDSTRDFTPKAGAAPAAVA